MGMGMEKTLVYDEEPITEVHKPATDHSESIILT